MADESDNTVRTSIDNKAHVRRQWFKKRIIWIPLTVIVILAAGIVSFRLVSNSNRTNQAALSQLKILQKNLQTAMNSANPQLVVNNVNLLLDGRSNRTFTFTNAQLSTYYLDRANAYLNMKQYKNAVSDYEQAITLDSGNKLVALQGEVEARYKLGDRQQLITVYQQMIDLESQSQNPMRGSVTAQYEDNIQTLQQGGELQF